MEEEKKLQEHNPDDEPYIANPDKVHIEYEPKDNIEKGICQSTFHIAVWHGSN